MSRYENRGDDSYHSDEPESLGPLEDGLETPMPRQVTGPLNDAARTAVISQINGSLTALLIYMAELRNHSHAFGPVKEDQTYLKQVVENAFQQIGRVCDLVKQIEDDAEGIGAVSSPEVLPGRGFDGSQVTGVLLSSAAAGQRPLTKREREVLSLI